MRGYSYSLFADPGLRRLSDPSAVIDLLGSISNVLKDFSDADGLRFSFADSQERLKVGRETLVLFSAEVGNLGPVSLTL
jgi:hypothetical protein